MTGVTSPELTALDINIANNLAQQAVLGSVEARGIRKGSLLLQALCRPISRMKSFLRCT